VPAWLLHSPGEYAERAIAFLTYLKDKHNITTQFYSICNEAGNNNAFSPQVVGAMIRTLAPKLQALGLPTRIQFPECVNAKQSWEYVQALQNDPAIWPHIGLISYHLYGPNDPFRSKLRDFAVEKGLPTGQTEFMGLTVQHLYDDLTLGGASVWEYYALRDYLQPNPSNTWFTHTGTYWSCRQILRYARPGAVRVAATSSEEAVRALAFLKDGKTTAILLNNTGGPKTEVNLKGLSAAKYGVSQSVGGAACVELGVRNVAAGDSLKLALASGAVLTVYPCSGANQPPTITNWQAAPPFLTAPASSLALSAAAVDPELEPLSYKWAIVSQPAGATAVLSDADKAKAQATSLSVAGDYLFSITVSDGKDSVTRSLPVTVFAGNQPPEILGVHNRIPVMVTLPQSSTTLRGNARDIENDPLKYAWSVLRQPAGADAKLATPDDTSCVASNLTVAGDYVFKLEVSEPLHTVSRELTVTVFHAERPPLISDPAAAPALVKAPESSTSLSASTSDPDGGVITHWWTIKSAPAGAAPIFESNGAPKTKVTSLGVPGKYIFTLAVINRTQVARKDITVTVEGAGR